MGDFFPAVCAPGATPGGAAVGGREMGAGRMDAPPGAVPEDIVGAFDFEAGGGFGFNAGGGFGGLIPAFGDGDGDGNRDRIIRDRINWDDAVVGDRVVIGVDTVGAAGLAEVFSTML